MDNTPYEFEECVYVNNTTQQERERDKFYQKFLEWKAVPRNLEGFVSGIKTMHSDECPAEGAPKFCTVAGRMLLYARHVQDVKENNAPSSSGAKVTP